MKSRETLVFAVVLAVALAVNAVAAEPGSGAAAAPAPRAKTTAVSAKSDTSATSRASARRAQPVAKAAASRRLEVTHIQGDIPVPQVLFVTARDQRRFMSVHHQRYLKSSRKLAESTPLPERMIVTRGERPEVEP